MLGAESHFLGDGIKRAYEARVSKPPQYGFSQDTLISRRQILQAACETLANSGSRRNYNQGLMDDEQETIITQVPWDKVVSNFQFFSAFKISVWLLRKCRKCRFLERCACCKKQERLKWCFELGRVC